MEDTTSLKTVSILRTNHNLHHSMPSNDSILDRLTGIHSELRKK